MSVREPDFAGELVILQGIHKWNPNFNTECAAVATALASDTTTHDQTIEARIAGLRIREAGTSVYGDAGTYTRLTNDLLLLVNVAKAGNLPNASIIAAIDDFIAVVHKPGVVTIPYASANASPPIVGTVCSVTNGTWSGVPTSYTYAWQRNGVAIGGATAATYTLVSADTGSKSITCVVTAVNAQGSTAAPPSNAIAVP